MKRPSPPKWIIASSVPIIAFLLGITHAATSTFNLNILYSSGSVAPSDTPPWATLSTTDVGENHVNLTFTATGLVGSEFIDSWYLNINLPDSEINNSNFTVTQTKLYGSFSSPTISFGPNDFPGDGGGYYDMKVNFSQPSGTDVRFDQGDSLMLSLIYTPATPDPEPVAFNAMSFDVWAAPHGGSGPFATTAHVQSIGPSGASSAWIASNTAPESSTAILSALTLAANVFARKRRDNRI